MKTKRAKLGMRVVGSAKPEAEPEPGTPAFGRRAAKRVIRLRPKPLRVEQDSNLSKGIFVARRKAKGEDRA